MWVQDHVLVLPVLAGRPDLIACLTRHLLAASGLARAHWTPRAPGMLIQAKKGAA
jgi:hypothetical protein